MKLNRLSIALGSLVFVFIANSEFVMAYTQKESDCKRLYQLTKQVDPSCRDVLDSNGNIRPRKLVIKISDIYVDGGKFYMGSDKKSTHSLTVSSFYIGKYEVSQKEYKAVMETNPSNFIGDTSTTLSTSNLPVETVSFDDVIAFCNKYNQMKGLPNAYGSNGNIINKNSYRLPTEAEWEYAARGGNKSQGYKYSGSNDPDQVSWYNENSYNKGSSSTEYATHKLGTKKPNELGIYDMSGNVMEWVSDWYDENYYSKSPSLNPYNSNSNLYRLIRGGSLVNNISYLNVSNRYYNKPSFKYKYLGFRLTRSK